MCSFVFFFKQQTAYEMRISDWSSDVCSSDLTHPLIRRPACPTVDPRPLPNSHCPGVRGVMSARGAVVPTVEPDPHCACGVPRRLGVSMPLLEQVPCRTLRFAAFRLPAIRPCVAATARRDRKSDVEGKSVSVR